MPWSDMVAGTGMPQTYTITPTKAREAVAQMASARGHTSIVPIGPAYGPHSGANLRRIWSWPQMRLAEWRELESVERG